MRAASLLKLLAVTLAASASATRLPGPFSNRNMRIRPSFKNLATLWATCSLGGLIFTWRAYRAANAPESPLDALRHVHDLRPLYSPPKTPNRRTEPEV